MTYQGPDRRQMPDPNAVSALGVVAESIDRMTATLETNLSEERLTKIVANEQKRDRIKLLAAIVGPVIIVGVVAAFGLAQGRANNDQNEQVAAQAADAKVVADYVQHCLQGRTEGLTQEQVIAECGSQNDGVATAVKALFCVLLTEPESREPSDLNECLVRVQKGEFG